MFRRDKDDISSESETTAPQGSLLGGAFSESATVINPADRQQAAPAASSAYQFNAAARPETPPASRPMPPAASAPQAPSSFRPGQPPATGVKPAMPSSYAPAAPLPPVSAATRSESSRRVLTVGADILLKGEIATCDRLVIEGKVDAALNDVGTVELAETGSFKGVAHVENAEISGLFEGELAVKGRLVIYASGKVRGKVTYGEIEIERGGELSGEIKTFNASGGQPQARPAARVQKDDKVAA